MGSPELLTKKNRTETSETSLSFNSFPISSIGYFRLGVSEHYRHRYESVSKIWTENLIRFGDILILILDFRTLGGNDNIFDDYENTRRLVVCDIVPVKMDRVDAL